MIAWMWGALALGAPSEPYEHPTVLTEQGPLVLLHTSVDAVVQLGMAVVDVRQTFHNPYDQPIDATYVFPLSPGAAVRAMTMRCGGRELVASIAEKEEARERYEQAVSEGRKAALLEQQRADLFTQEVGRLCPGELVEIDLQYAEALERDHDAWTLVFPTTVGERYAPTDLALPPMVGDPKRRIDVSVTLDEGLPIGSVWSDSHAIAITDSARGATIALAEGDDLPDKDLHLSWTLVASEPAAAALVARREGLDERFVAVRIEPPPADTIDVTTPRELLFVLDASCSMSGEPWAASLEVVRAALDDMRPDDTFNLVKFSGAATSLFDTPAAATPGNRALAKQWMTQFVGGGTEMTQGIVHSLDMPGDPRALRIVLLLTDGYIGNDREVLATTQQHLSGNDRVFALGIGSSPNRGLLEELAHHGRGDAMYALLDTPVDEVVAAFADRIETPVLTDVEVDFGGLDLLDQVPSVLPDLFAGQSIRVAGRVLDEVRPTMVTVRGRLGDQAVSYEVWLDPEDIRAHEAVPVWWARERIREIERDLVTPDDVRKAQVLPVALEHHLVSTYTSLVAVDQGVSACGSPWIAPSVSVEVPTMIPQGTTPTVGGTASSGIGGAIGGLLGVKGTQAGAGGLGSRGSGLGGGGSASGFGGLGRRLGPQSAGGIVQTETTVLILGSLDRSLIDEVIKRNLNKIRYCYQRELTRDPKLAGKVVVEFTIAEDGSVASSTTKESTLANETAELCIRGQILRMRFPTPEGEGVVVVTYPFNFSPQ